MTSRRHQEMKNGRWRSARANTNTAVGCACHSSLVPSLVPLAYEGMGRSKGQAPIVVGVWTMMAFKVGVISFGHGRFAEGYQRP